MLNVELAGGSYACRIHHSPFNIRHSTFRLSCHQMTIRWPRLYAIVLAELAILIALFYARIPPFTMQNSTSTIPPSLPPNAHPRAPPLRHRARRTGDSDCALLRLHEVLLFVRPIDWVVLGVTLFAIVTYGIWKGRKHKSLDGYLLAGRTLQWPTIALSIMATQASAITFLSTPGQAYADGMRFVQFYLGLPVAVVLLAIVAVPIYHRLKVYTAYEYLETRFGPKTRGVTAALFLAQRGVSTGLTVYAPAVIVSLLLGWNIHVTNIGIGLLVIAITVGGTKAVSRTHVHQLLIALAGMAVALTIAIRSLPHDVSLFDALHVAGRMGRLNAIDFTFDLKTPYNFWSGMIGGTLLMLSYFGCDQSQVQRYLTGETVEQSRLGLLINGMIKVPMQFFILFVGAIDR